MKTIIIIPAYNEEQVIGQVIGGILRQQDLTADILVIDDGSSDQTFSIAKRAGAITLRHKINRGQGAAIKTGIDFALRHNYESVVFFDADGQMDPTEISILLDKLAQGYDVVLGSRNLGRAIAMPPVKRLVKKLALTFTKLTTGLKLTDTHNGFQVWTSSALKSIRLDQDRMAYASQVLNEIAKLKFKYIEMPVTIKYTNYSKKKGQSIWNSFSILWDLLIK